jgi:hypothetical protein
MNFFAFYKSLSPMSVRQRFRYVRLVWKKVRQTHRAPNETELAEILAQVLNEFDLILRSVGGLTIAWAEVDMILDHINGLLAFNPALATKTFPRTTSPLDQKIDFLESAFGMIPGLAALREKIPELITELKSIQTIRNDVVHGVALERTPVAVRKVMRVKAKGRSLDQTYKTYQLGEIAYAGVHALELRKKLITLFADSMRILDPELASQFVSELPSFSTRSQLASDTSPDESDRAAPQRYIPRAFIIYSVVNTVAGLVIGVANVSWFYVFLTSLVWGVVTWLVVTLISGRASKSKTLFFGSPTITRFIIWCLISFLTSLIVGTFAFAIR